MENGVFEVKLISCCCAEAIPTLSSVRQASIRSFFISLSLFLVQFRSFYRVRSVPGVRRRHRVPLEEQSSGRTSARNIALSLSASALIIQARKRYGNCQK